MAMGPAYRRCGHWAASCRDVSRLGALAMTLAAFCARYHTTPAELAVTVAAAIAALALGWAVCVVTP